MIDFKNGAEGSPERQILDTIEAALQIVAFDQFLGASLANIFANVTLSDLQKIAIKAAAKGFPQNGSADNLNNLLLFVLYGDFQTVGLAEASAEPLTGLQRISILEQISATARGILAAKAAALQAMADAQFEAPDQGEGNA